MGYPTKVQCIKRKSSEQWYINFPSAIAQAMEFTQSEDVEWVISDKKYLILERKKAPADPVKIKKNSEQQS
jgi:antitoxin component of MazEF toxin-antitoxin module